ncbi:hypothetical protein [Sphingorhabdus sp. Alg231-15]|uniref:hypothetical protein n=1 Tax=Sphingorhabdus sp. Alg231-15 TaxID=1922222 RepID=UPI000D554B5E
MTGKVPEELDEQELDKVTGGGTTDSHDAYANLEVSHLKSGSTKGTSVRATRGLSKSKKQIVAQAGDGEI